MSSLSGSIGGPPALAASCSIGFYSKPSQFALGPWPNSRFLVTAALKAVELSGYPSAVNPSTNRIYVPDLAAGPGNVAVINGATDLPADTVLVPVGNAPAVNVNTNRIYVTNFADDTVSVINGSTNSVVTAIPVADGPFGVAVNHSGNKVYVVDRNAGKLSVIDGATNTVSNTLTVGTNPFYVSVLEYEE